MAEEHLEVVPKNVIHKNTWEVKPVALALGQAMVSRLHYARGGANTATYMHGLFQKGNEKCWGIAWWIPPTKHAAIASAGLADWLGVLALSRLVIEADAPKNSASFLLAHSIKLIDVVRWPVLVTYADEWQGHKGTIYKASNWTYKGLTAKEATWVLNGRLLARKAGPKTRTKADMEALGAIMVGRFSKHKFVMDRRKNR